MGNTTVPTDAEDGNDHNSKETGQSRPDMAEQGACTTVHSDSTRAEKKSEVSSGAVTRKFQINWLKQYSWLKYDQEKNLMYCTLCRTHNKDNIMNTGTNNFRTSTITRHVEHNDHKLLILGSQIKVKKNTEAAWGNLQSKESLGVITAMKAVYFLAKEYLPLAKYPKILELFRNVNAEHIHNLSLTEGENMYDSSYACDEFLDAINQTLYDIVSEKLQKATNVTILTDESTDIAQHKKLVIWALCIDSNTSMIPELHYLTDLRISEANGRAIFEAIQQHLKERGLDNMNTVFGLGTDGASVMTGTKAGVTGQFLRENPMIVNVHCLAHRLALVSSQSTESFTTLKEFQQTLTDLFYYFKHASAKVQALENIQKVLELPTLKVREVHQVRWLSFFEALSSVQKSLPALLTYFEGIDKRKDPKGEGMARKICTYKFVYLTHLMLDVLAPIMILSQSFQKKNLDPAMVGVHLETCKTALWKIPEGKQGSSFVKLLENDVDEGGKTYKNCKISMTKIPTTLMSKFVEKLNENLSDRFPQTDILAAYGVLSMRPISFQQEKLCEWGNEKVQMLIDHFGSEKVHEWTEKGTKERKVVGPYIDGEATKDEWQVCKRVVLAEMFPRDVMLDLWVLIHQYHKEKFPNLIKLAALALTSPTHTADCERSFSVQNYITTSKRASISPETCDKLMRICVSGSELEKFDFERALHVWRSKKRRNVFSVNKK